MNERETYFREARSWAEDSRVRSARSRKVAWTVAGVAIGAAAFEAVALAMLVPLKTVQPITLLVDRQTGFVQALDPMTPQRVAADAALTDAYLAQYVSAREGFDRATIQLDYRRVALWSAGRARSSYLSMMAAGNPANPVQTYSTGTTISVRVKSVSRLQAGVSLIRFDTQRLDRNGQAEAPRPWISVVRYRYSEAPMAFGDRLVNPLGFQVTGYRRDAEAPAEPLSEPSPSIARTTVAPSTPQPAVVTSPQPLRRRMSSTTFGPATASRPMLASAGSGTRREVPMNQIPMGSPLGPGPNVVSLAKVAQP
jgi:type IV secretion system protein VirB8